MSTPQSSIEQSCINWCGAVGYTDGTFNKQDNKGFCRYAKNAARSHRYVPISVQIEHDKERQKYAHQRNTHTHTRTEDHTEHHTEHHSTSVSNSNIPNYSSSGDIHHGRRYRYPINTTPGGGSSYNVNPSNGNTHSNRYNYKGSNHNGNRHQKQYDNDYGYMKINNNIMNSKWRCSFCCFINSEYMNYCESCYHKIDDKKKINNIIIETKDDVKIEEDYDDAKTVYNPQVNDIDEQLKNLVLNEDNNDENNQNDIVKNAESTPESDDIWSLQEKLSQLTKMHIDNSLISD
eukprot:105977_1